MRRQRQVHRLARFKAVHHNLGADRHGFLEGPEVLRADYQTARRGHLQAAPALIARFKVQVQLAGVLPVFHQRLEGAGRYNLLAGFFVGAVFAEPVAVKVMHIVHLAARLAGHAAQRQVLESRPKAAAWVPLDVGKVDDERSVMNHAAQLPLGDVLVSPLPGIDVLIAQPVGGVHRAAQGFVAVAALLMPGHIPI